MVNITLSIPEELHQLVKQHAEIKWSEIVRRAMWDYAQKLQEMDKILAKSKLTEKDALELGNLINKKVAERHRALLAK